MLLQVQIAARVSRKLKQRLAAEVRRRRALGEGVAEADITRQAILEYFGRLEAGGAESGKAVN